MSSRILAAAPAVLVFGLLALLPGEARAVTGLQPPTNVTATPASLTEIDLTWTVSTGATGFNVLRSPTPGGPYSLIATVKVCSYWDTGLTGGTTYYYVVQATNATQTSGNSAEVSTTTATQPPLPVPANLTAVTFSTTRIDLSWTAAAGATGYRILRANSSAGPYNLVGVPSGTTFSSTKLLANTTYYYEVQSTNGSRVSGPSSFITATTITPLAPTLTATMISGTQINLAWTASTGATGYNVLRGSASGGPYSPLASSNGASFSDTGLSPSNAYYYVVKATNGALVSGNSNQAVAATTLVWLDQNPLTTPVPRLAPVATGVDGMIYGLCGATSGSFNNATNGIDQYNPLSNSWQSITPSSGLLTARHNLAVVAGPDGNLYVTGGVDGSGSAIGNVDQFNPVTRAVANIAGLQEARQNHVSAVIGNKIYVIGGSNSSTTVITDAHQVEVFDTTNVAGGWTDAANANFIPVQLAMAARGVDGKIYVFGGRDQSGVTRDLVQCFDGLTWTNSASSSLKPMPTVREYGAAAAAPDGRVYVIGGLGTSGKLSSVEAYDPSANSWTTVATLADGPTFANAAATAPDGRIFNVFGLTSTNAYSIGTQAYGPQITLTLVSGFGGTGSKVTVTGSNFAPSATTVSVFFGDQSGTLLVTTTTASNGTLVPQTVTIPDLAVATVLTVVDNVSNYPVNAPRPNTLFLGDLGGTTVYTSNAPGVFSAFATVARPVGMAFDLAGNLYVADFADGSIRRVTPGGAVTVFVAGGSVGSPQGLAFDTAGNLYVADSSSGRVFKITSGGVVTVFVSGAGTAVGIAFDKAGNLYVADTSGGGGVNKFSRSGTFLAQFASISQAHGLAFDASGNLFVADLGGGNVWKVTPAGVKTVLASSSTSLLRQPQGLTVGPDGTIYVGDNTAPQKVFTITPGGFVTPLAGATSLANIDLGIVFAPLHTFTPVDLSGSFTVDGITLDGTPTNPTPGVDAAGSGFSANALALPSSWASGIVGTAGGIPFNLVIPSLSDVPNDVLCASQVVTLPTGKYSKLSFLAVDSGVSTAGESGKTFTVTYTDTTTTVLTQSVSDILTNSNYTGESLVTTGSLYVNFGNGTTNKPNPAFLHQYTITLDPTKTVQSITLCSGPGNLGVSVFAMTLVP